MKNDLKNIKFLSYYQTNIIKLKPIVLYKIIKTKNIKLLKKSKN